MLAGIEVSDRGDLRDQSTGRLLDVPAYRTKASGPPFYRRFRGRYVHHLVLEAFVGPRPHGMQCRHINGNSLDNRLKNLAWGTPSEDNYDRVRHGTHQHSRRKLCKYGHPLDGVAYKPDGSVHQRLCTECRRIRGRKRRAAKMQCPQGHDFDGVRYNRDGSVRQRYCTVCVGEQLSRGRLNR